MAAKRIKQFIEHLKKFIEEDSSLKWICKFEINKSPSSGFEVQFYNKKKTNFKMLGKEKNDLLFVLYLRVEKKHIFIGNIDKKYAPLDKSKSSLYDYRNHEAEGYNDKLKINELEKALEYFEYLFLFKLERQPKEHYYNFKNRPWDY
tara:strand:+ start:80 stop:520 length:441 start_codon:yes stop_codon:yes gene_type:complete